MATQPRLVNKQFNSPINLYSNQNVKEVLTRESQMLANGAVGINFYNPSVGKPTNLQNSAVLRMLEEEENRQRNGQLSTKRVAWPPPSDEYDEQAALQAQGGTQNSSSPGLQNNFSSGRQSVSPAPQSRAPLKPLDISSATSPQYQQSLKSPLQNQSPIGFRPQTPTRQWAPVQSPVTTHPPQNVAMQQYNQTAQQQQHQQQQSYKQTYQQQQYHQTQQYQRQYETQQQYQPASYQYESTQQYHTNQQYQTPQTQYESTQQTQTHYQQPQQQYQSVQQQHQSSQQQYQPSQQQFQSPKQQYQPPQQQYQPPQQQYQPAQQYQPPQQQQPPQHPPPQQQYQATQQVQYQAQQQQSQQYPQQNNYQSQQQPQSPQQYQTIPSQPSTQQAFAKPGATSNQAPNQYRPQGGAKNVEPPPSTITLRPQAPVSQAPPPLVTSQPATATLRGGKHLRGDLKWPPENVKVKMEEEVQKRLELAKGPAFKPRKVQKDYSNFFAQHALNSTYPGYKIPPGTQFFRPV